MSTVDVYQGLLTHNDWGREKILNLASEVDDADLDREFEMGPGSLRKTCQHLWAAERVWLDRWTGRKATPYERLETPLSLDELRLTWRATAAERNGFVNELGPEGYAREVVFTDRQGNQRQHVQGDLILHVCNHGMHHRAQAANMLRRLGADVPGLDYLFMRVDPECADLPVPQFDLDVIRRYFAYGDWAQQQTFAAAMDLPDDKLDRPFDMGVGTLRRTLIHICEGEYWWLDNWIKGPSKTDDGLLENMPVAQAGELYEETARKRNAFLEGLSAEDLQRDASCWITPERMLTFALGETMLQLHSHGTHHRAQARNMLRHLGVSMHAVDLLRWLGEMNENRAG